jgi:type II secretory pathway predicted ATPase ExeA
MSIDTLLTRVNQTQTALATHCGVSKASISLLVKKGIWPATELTQIHLRAAISTFFLGKGIGHADVDKALAYQHQTDVVKQEKTMLLDKQYLEAETMKHFGLMVNPFKNDVTSVDDIFYYPALRQMRERVWDIARNGGFAAVWGESGCGKTTLREELHERIRKERASIIVVEPYVLAMEGVGHKGPTLKSGQIADAIIRTLDPCVSPKMAPDAKFAQTHNLLKRSFESGTRVVLMIEEAHNLPLATLKHLKRYLELKDGFSRLLGIVLIGQPELKAKMSPSRPDIREVVQRCDMFEMVPLGRDLDGYLTHRLTRAGVKASDLFEAGVAAALSEKLTRTVTEGRQARRIEMTYPLLVNNYLVLAMNHAAAIGLPKITPDLIRDAA